MTMKFDGVACPTATKSLTNIVRYVLHAANKVNIEEVMMFPKLMIAFEKDLTVTLWERKKRGKGFRPRPETRGEPRLRHDFQVDEEGVVTAMIRWEIISSSTGMVYVLDKKAYETYGAFLPNESPSEDTA